MINKRFMLSLLSIFIATIMLVVYIQYSYNSNINSLIDGNQELLSQFQIKNEMQRVIADITFIPTQERRMINNNIRKGRKIIDDRIKKMRNRLFYLKTIASDADTQEKLNELDTAVAGTLQYYKTELDKFYNNPHANPDKLLAYGKTDTLINEILTISSYLTTSKESRLTELIQLADTNAKAAKKWGLTLAILAIAASIYTFLYINKKVALQAALIEQLNESEKKLTEAAKIKETFMANMSHEIRTPMNAILGFIHLLQKQDQGVKSKEFLSAIQSASENLLTIINDILDFSKIEAGMMHIEATPFSLRGLINSVKTMFIAKAEEKGLLLTAQTDENIPDILSGDAVRLTQILVNLIGNSIKFTDLGKIEIEVINHKLEENTVYVSFSVKDTGIGIAPDKIANVFERFHQGDEDTTRKYGGTGLGLAIVKQLADLQKGSVTVHSEAGKGSWFVCTIPYKIIHQPALIQRESAQAEKKFAQVKKPVTLLVVEDNVMNQNLMRHLLTEWGIQYKIAQNGAEAIEEVKANKFDLILMDIQMPQMNGYTAAQMIRNELKLSVPIVAMTAHALAGEREKCLSYGMNEYVAKPIKEKELYKIIETLTTQQPEVAGETFGALPLVSHLAFNTIDLTYLQELSGGKKSFQKEITEQFIAQLPTELQQLEAALNKGDYEICRQLAHNMKTSVSFMGLTEKLNEPLDYIEDHALSEKNSSQISSHFLYIKTICIKALEEAKDFLSDLNKSIASV